MADALLTIDYVISNIVVNVNGTTSVTYTMSHAGTGLNSTRTDAFQTILLDNNVNTSTDSTQTKLNTLQTNFQTLANVYFKNFAVTVRAAQAASDVTGLNPSSGDVVNLSVGNFSAIHGKVIVGS